MAKFFKSDEIKRSLEPTEVKRYSVDYDPMRQAWLVVDLCRVSEEAIYNNTLPDESYVAIPDRIMREIIKGIADTKLIDHILADKTYRKDVEERHLDIIEKLIDKGK